MARNPTSEQRRAIEWLEQLADEEDIRLGFQELSNHAEAILSALPLDWQS
jgi:hypothetical protein